MEESKKGKVSRSEGEYLRTVEKLLLLAIHTIAQRQLSHPLVSNYLLTLYLCSRKTHVS